MDDYPDYLPLEQLALITHIDKLIKLWCTANPKLSITVIHHVENQLLPYTTKRTFPKDKIYTALRPILENIWG
jgi:hypothetical protein